MTDLFTYHYPAIPGHRGTDTSIAAAASMHDSAPTLRSRVLDALARQPGTADECAARLGETILACRPRLTELQRLGLIEDTGERRANVSGRLAAVWTVRKAVHTEGRMT